MWYVFNCISVKQATHLWLWGMHSEGASDQHAWFRVVNLHVAIILLLPGRFLIPQILLLEICLGVALGGV